MNKYWTFNLKIPLNSTGRAVDLKEAIKAAISLTMTPANTLIQFNEGTARYHANLNLSKAQAIIIYKDHKALRVQEQNLHQVRVTRERVRLQQQLQQEELERYIEYGEMIDDWPLEDNIMYTSTETDEVTHPHFRYPVIQRTLANRKLIEDQADDLKVTHIMKKVIERQARKKRTFTKRAAGSMKNRTEFYMVDGVLYANKEYQGHGKPVLPQSMVITEIFRAHKATHHRGMQVALEHIRKHYHHSPATSEVTLEAMAGK